MSSAGTAAPQVATAATTATATGVNLGLRPFYATEKVDLTSRISATVNLATGNMVLDAAEVSVNAPGVAVDLHSYNNAQASGSGAYSYRQVLSTGQDVGLAVTTSTVTFSAPSGFTATFTADGSGGWTVPAGLNADLTHNSDGTWALTYHTSGEQLSFTAGGYLVKDADRNGVGYTLGYNTASQVVSLTDAAGQVTTVAYTTSGAIASITDPFSRVTAYKYSWDGYLAETDYPDGSKVNFGQNSARRVSHLTTPNGNYVHFYYDTSGRIIKIDRYLTAAATSGAASTTAFAYPSATSTTVTNPLGGVTTYTLDSVGRATNIIDSLGHSAAVTWTANSDTTSLTDANGQVTTYIYDPLNNPVSQVSPTGATDTTSYAPSAICPTTDTTHVYLPQCITDDSGDKTTVTYDAAGNPVTVNDASGTGGAQQTYTYQSASTSSGVQCGGKPGQVCSATDARGKVTTYTYDSAGRLTTVTPPTQLGSTTSQYDAAGRLTSHTDGLGHTTTYAYDKADRITKITLYTTTALTNFYDGDGNLTKNVDSYKGTTTFIFDTLDRETSRQDPSMSTAVTSTWDAAGNLISVSDPQGVVTYSFDTESEMTGITEPGARTTTLGYDNNGAELTRSFPNGVLQTTTRDASGRTVEIKAVNGPGTVLSDLAYSYTTTGVGADRNQVQTRTDKVGVGAPAGSVIAYGYDTQSRLTSAVEKTSAGAFNASWAYAYDNAGNITSRTLTGATTPTLTPATPASTTAWGYNDANEMTSRNGSSVGWSYNANGDQTSSPDIGTSAYGSRRTLSSITAPRASAVTQDYDYLGGGNTARTRAGTDSFTTNSLGLATRTTGTATTSYHYTDDGQLLSSQDPSGVSSYYLTDNLGSVVAITDTTGTKVASYAYDPYGGTRLATGPVAAANPRRYISGYLDTATGLYKLGARYYDPSVGRFTQLDPSGQETSYSYTDDDPINISDANGLGAQKSVGPYGVILVGLTSSGTLVVSFTPSRVVSGIIFIHCNIGSGSMMPWIVRFNGGGRGSSVRKLRGYGPALIVVQMDGITTDGKLLFSRPFFFYHNFGW